MSKKNLRICYSGSGIRSLRGWATVLIIFSVISVILIIIGISNSDDSSGNIALFIIGFSGILSGCIGAPLLRGIATIAETALIQKHLIMKEYDIKESDLESIEKDEIYENRRISKYPEIDIK